MCYVNYTAIKKQYPKHPHFFPPESSFSSDFIRNGNLSVSLGRVLGPRHRVRRADCGSQPRGVARGAFCCWGTLVLRSVRSRPVLSPVLLLPENKQPHASHHHRGIPPASLPAPLLPNILLQMAREQSWSTEAPSSGYQVGKCQVSPTS